MRAVFEDASYSPSKFHIVCDPIVEPFNPTIVVHLECDASVGVRPGHPVWSEFGDSRLDDSIYNDFREIDLIERGELHLREAEAHVPIGFAGSTVCSATTQQRSHTT
jgi:hypothetical protein